MRRRSKTRVRATPRLTRVFAGVIVTAGFGCVGCFGWSCPMETETTATHPVPPLGDDEASLRLACQQWCGSPDCKRVTTENGTPAVQCHEIRGPNSCGGAGRRPRGAIASKAARVGTGALAASILSRRADMEAASVPAFLELACDLERFGAPRSLLMRARRAAGDEARHARVMSDLALAFGGRGAVPVRRRATAAYPTLFAFAADNARTGCVEETFAALLARVESKSAADVRVRRVMRVIAADETRHAELAHAIDAWVREQLTPRENGALDRVHARAWKALARSQTTVGVPSIGFAPPSMRLRLAGSLAAALSRTTS